MGDEIKPLVTGSEQKVNMKILTRTWAYDGWREASHIYILYIYAYIYKEEQPEVGQSSLFLYFIYHGQ